jgi:hypothetical protein
MTINRASTDVRIALSSAASTPHGRDETMAGRRLIEADCGETKAPAIAAMIAGFALQSGTWPRTPDVS